MSTTFEKYDQLKLGPGWISKEDILNLRQYTGKSLERTLLDLVEVAKRFSHPEVSGFQVGAVALGQSGAVYFGANQEFAKADVTQTVHAEQAAIVNAYRHKELRVKMLAVSAEPCGCCRQFLYELANAAELQILFESDKAEKIVTLNELLPQAFGPKNLGIETAMFSNQSHQLRDETAHDELAFAAIDAAMRSYAPYTHAFAGVAIRTKNDKIFCGSYLENAAFNPSISPLWSGLVVVAMAGLSTQHLSNVVLVQRDDSVIDHSRMCKALIASMSGVLFTLRKVQFVGPIVGDKQ
jgi:cytidine deaminase